MQKICPMCESPMWDNIEKKASGQFKPTAPDYSCKNENCRHAIWPEPAKPRAGTKKAPETQASSSGDIAIKSIVLSQSKMLGEILMLVTATYKKVQGMEEKLDSEIFTEEINQKFGEDIEKEE